MKAFPVAVARAALAHWPGGAAATASLAGIATSGNDVWRFDAADGPAILRLTDRAWRTPAQNAAECGFLLHAAACGARVSVPVPSASGQLVEELPDADASASVFTWAPGERVATGDADFHREWGRAMATLHAAATTYAGPPRWEWHDEGLLAALRARTEERVSWP